MAAAHADYSWVTGFHNGLLSVSGYCLTLVRGVSITHAIDRLGGNDTGEVRDLEGLLDHAHNTQATTALRSSSAGLSELDGSTLIFEPNGFLGIAPAVAERLSNGTRLVSHFRNVNAHGRFCWWEEGETQLAFDPLFPSQRDGPQAGNAVPMLLTAGFDVDDRPGRPLDGTLAATFALAEHFTGIAMTAELLTTTAYAVASAPTRQ